MINFLKDVGYVIRATYWFRIIMARNGYKTLPLRKWESRPIGCEYIQITILTPRGNLLPQEVVAAWTLKASIEECLEMLSQHGLLWTAGAVQATNVGKYNTHALAECMKYRNYMLA